MALLLTLSPQTVKADYVDDNLTEPLTIEMPNAGVTASFKIYFAGATSSSSSTKVQTNLQYRLSSNGGAWGAWTNVLVAGTTKYSSVAGAAPTAVTLGGGGSPYKKWKIQFRGVNPDGFSRSSSIYYSISFESAASTRQINISGNVMSLIVGYDTSDETAAKATLAAANEIPNEYCFYRLFHYVSGISNKMNINATNLIFPATKLKSHCYEDMFYDATGTSTYGLQQAPTFLATDFVDKDGNAVSSSFAGLCNNCQKFTSIHVNFQHCYAVDENNLTNWLKSCGSSRTIYAPAAFRTCANNPNTGLSDAVWNGWTKTEWSKEVGPSTHTVTLAVDGTDSYGTLTAASIADVPHGATITVSSNTITINGTTVTATKTSDGGGYNYAFAGWYNGVSQLTGNSNSVDNDMTITAHFTRAANTYYVSFDADEGSGTMTDQTFTYGVAQNLKPNAFTGPAVTVTYNYNGATGGTSPASETVNASFFMWTDGSGVNFYEDEESVSNLTATNGATVALTAIWDFDQEVTLPSPTKTGYTFVQWESGEEPFFVIAGGAGEGFAPYEDVTLNAHWNAINYTITYNGLNGASSNNPASYTIESSTIVLANPGTRTGYTFTGWTDDDNSNAAVTQIAAGSTGNRHFTANWSADTYNLTYEGLNGATNSNPATYTVETATFALANPGTRAGYTFAGWTCGGNPITQITLGSTGDKTITANWSTNTHNVSWVTDGNALTGTYTNGTTAYGTTIVAPNTPTKNTTAEYTYAFNGWLPAVDATMPDNDVTYTAQWTATPVNYTLTWDFDGGSTVTAVGDYTSGTVAYGTTIVAPADPTKEGCTFNGWDVTPAGTMPAANTTYTAQWTACATELHIVLDEHAEDGDDYYDDFQKYNGVTATTVTLNRQFGQGKWATLCLPFEVSYGQMTSLRMKGRVYEFRHATGNANDGNQVTLFFAQAEKLTAGKAYIVNANAKLAELTQFVFHNVTINTSADQIKPLNSISQYNDLADLVGYSDGTGTIQLVGTLRLGTLKGSNSGNTYMGLKDNKIYYPSTSEPGSTVWAYRGVFRSTTPLGAQRIRIVVEGDEGEEVTELEVINGELQQAGEAKKFVQDGVLYIEREGVIYDATGKLRIEN